MTKYTDVHGNQVVVCDHCRADIQHGEPTFSLSPGKAAEGYVLRDYVDARIFSGPPPGRELQRITLPVQPQGEAITWSATGDALLIASEGDDRLLRVPIAVEPSPSAEPSRESALEPQRQRPQEPSSGPIPAVTIALVLLAVAALSLVLLISERARRRGGTAESPEQ